MSEQNLTEVLRRFVVWDDIYLNLSSQMQYAMDEVVKVLERSTLPMAMYLLEGTQFSRAFQLNEGTLDFGLTPKSKQDINNIVDLLIAKSKGNLKRAHDQIIVVSSVIEQGNKQGFWELPLPPIPILVEREKNPIQRSNFMLIKKARVWEHAILQSISREISLSDKAKVGRVLCSALFRCGLLQTNTLNTLLNQLSEPILVVNDRSYINLSLRKFGQDAAEKRRVFLDPCTETLWLHLDVVLPDAASKVAWIYIKCFLRETQGELETLPKSMTELIEAAACLLHLHIPPFLINYAKRKTISHSLKSVAWLRLNHVLPPLEPKVITIPHFSADKDDEQNLSEHLDRYGRPDWAQKIHSSLKEGSSKAAIHHLESLSANPLVLAAPPLCKYMIGWAIYLLKHGTKTSKKLKVKRVQADVSAILPRLYGLIAHDDFTTFNSETYEETYSQILEGASSSNVRNKMANRLREFHYYLCHEHGSPQLDNTLLTAGNQISEVDANLVSIEEYEATLKHLEVGPLNFMYKDLPRVAQLITIIAFRCGLRRSEVLKLRLIDIQGSVNPEIILRPHATRNLKTGNSTRRVLISYLLEQHEQDMLLEWVHQRRQQEEKNAYSPYVFCIQEMRVACLSASMIFSHIHQALREVTGDSSLRFHHLRHASASWNLLRLMVADYGMPKGFFDHLPKTKAWLMQSKSFKKGLYQHDQPTRKHLYAITNHIGHASPAMTLEHYIHWCDILLHQSLSQVFSPLKAKHWQCLTQMPKATAHRLINHDNVLPILKKIRKAKQNAVFIIKVSLKKHDVQKKVNDHFESFVGEQVLQTWEMLYLHSKLGMTAQHLIERYSFAMAEIEHMLEHARYISEMTSQKGANNYRHRMLQSNRPADRYICPQGIKGESATLLAQDFLGRLDRLMREDPKACTWLLNYFVSHAWHNSNDLIFRECTSAKRYLTILGQLHINKKHIHLTWYHGKKVTGVSTQGRVAYWKSGLKLDPGCKVKQKKLNNESNLGRNGWFSIRLDNYLHDHVKNDQANCAFRFAMVMYSILCHRHT